MDADAVALRDFRSTAKLFSNRPYSADILMSLATSHPLKPTDNLKQTPSINAGIMYFSTNQRSIEFLTNVIRRLESDRKLPDQDAFCQAVEQVRHVTLTGIFGPIILGIGVVGHDHYPTESDTQDVDFDDDGLNEDLSIPTINRGKKLFGFAQYLLYGTDQFKEKVRIHFLDPLEFINGRVYFQHPELIPQSFDGFRIIHANDQKEPIKSIKDKELWFVSDDGKCLNQMNL